MNFDRRKHYTRRISTTLARVRGGTPLAIVAAARERRPIAGGGSVSSKRSENHAMPFSIEQFLNVFADYNLAVWPLQLALVCLAIIAVILALISHSRPAKIISLLLALFWSWTGIVYHIAFFTRINQAAYIFGGLCLIQAAIFVLSGAVRGDLIFRARKDPAGILGSLFIFYALVGYPALGQALGHVYPAAPTFGAPCPTTIFTFGILLWTEGKFPRLLLWIPLLWSLIGLSAAISLGMREDFVLPISGAITTAILHVRNRRSAGETTYLNHPASED
jgi:hypothetical protein